MDKIKIASINIWGSFANPQMRMEKAISFINHHDFDVVCFQEITREPGLGLKAIQAKTGLNHGFLMQNPNGDGVYEGCAILSKHNLENTAAYRLPDSNPSRFLLETRLQNTNFQIFATHLSYQTHETLPQIKETLKLTAESEKAVIIGDFNIDLNPVVSLFNQFAFDLKSTTKPTWPVDVDFFKKSWEEKHAGPLYFEPQKQTLDGIFSKNIDIKSEILHPVWDNKMFSDHMVVTAEIKVG